MRTALLVAALAVLTACSSSGSGAASTPKETVSASGDPQCAVSYHSTSAGTALTVATTVAGKLEVNSAGVGSADQTSYTVTANGTMHATIKASPLESLSADLTIGSGATYHCSIAPS